MKDIDFKAMAEEYEDDKQMPKEMENQPASNVMVEGTDISILKEIEVANDM